MAEEGKLKEAKPELGVSNAINQLVGETGGLSKDETQTDLEHKFRQAGLDGDVKLLRKMLGEKQVEVNCQNPKTKQTVMHAACTSANLEAVTFLLTQEGIDVTPKDLYGNTPFDLLPTNGADAAKIRTMLNERIDGEGEKKDPLEKLGKVIPVEKLKGSLKYHVYLVHAYKDKSKAKKIKQKLEQMGVVVAMSKSMMANVAEIKKQVDSSKIILILGSKSLLEKLKDPIKFQKSSCVAEMDSFVNDKDCAEIIVASLDSNSKLSAWNDCMEYAPVIEEGVVYDLSNEKLMTENFPSLYQELRVKITS